MDHSYFPLSLSQQNILNQELKFNNTPINNICTTLNIRGRVDFTLLEETINHIIKLDDSLRMRFYQADPIVQYISPYQYLQLPLFDFSLTNQEGIDQWTETIARELMPLFDQDMFQFRLYKTEEAQGGLLIKTHHLISDGFTQVLLCNRIAEIYLKKINQQPLADVPIFTYQSHIDKQSDYLSSNRYLNDQKYWEKLTKDFPKAVSIKDHKSAAVTYTGKRLTFVLDEKQNHLIYRYCLKKRISPFSLFYMALAIWLKRARNINKFTLGVPIVNRNDYQEKNTSGMFVSTLPFLGTINEDHNINEFNEHLMSEWLDLLKHQKYPFNDIYQLAKKADPEHQELFHIVLSYQNSLAYQVDSTQVYFDGRWNYSGYQAQHLCIHVSNRLDQQRYTIDYDYLVQLFNQEEIKKIHEMMMIIIQDALSNQEKPIWALNFLSDEIENKVLYRFSDAQVHYLKLPSLKKTLLELSHKTPRKIALIFKGERLSYKDLLDKALVKASSLKSNDGPIILVMSRSLELIISMVACILSDKPWIIIDPNTPIERIEIIIKDAEADLCLSLDPISLSITNVLYDALDISESIVLGSDDPERITYIVYTSGTTGRPKGVRIKEKSIVNFARASSVLYGYQAILSLCNVSFDAFVLETLVSLLNDQTIVLAEDDKVNNTNYLISLINDHAVGVLAMTPSRLSAYMQNTNFLKTLKRMETIICGGEIFPSELLQKLNQYTDAKIINQYGPSEATIGVSDKELNDARYISVGKPMNGCRIYVLDDHLLPLPIGSIGEIYISGICLADGYQNNPTETAAVFTENPFEPNESLYKTKDNGYWNEEGDLVIVGRIDDQIKFHGYRIELQEISARLISHHLIKDAVTITSLINDKQVLIAYYVSDQDLSVGVIREYLARFLPYYMLPQHFIKITRIPLNDNGKVDHSQLPTPLISVLDQKPTSKLENDLLAIFKLNLDIDDLSINSDYFLSGGDSLSAIQLLSLIEENTGIRMSIMDMYTLRTIKALAEKYGNDSPLLISDIFIKNPYDHYPLTPIQKNIYVLQTIGQDTAYNMPGYIKLSRPLDQKRLANAFKILLETEPILRSSFRIKGNDIIADIVDYQLTIKETQATDLDQALSSFIRVFNLDQPPLIRVSYCIIQDDHYLLVDMHHIIMDGISTPIFLNKLLLAYQGESISEDQWTYPDYAFWLNKPENNNIDDQLKYWSDHLQQLPPLFNPTHNPYMMKRVSRTNRVDLVLDQKLNSMMSETVNKTKITQFNLLISAFGILLHQISGQDTISLGTVVAGRDRPHTAEMIGVFINTLPLIIKFDHSQSIKQLLLNTSNDLMNLIANQDVSLETILSNLKVERQVNTNALYNILFSFRPFENENILFDDQEVELISAVNPKVKMDLSLDIYRQNDQYHVQYDYDQAIYNQQEIIYYHQCYEYILKQICNDQTTTLKEITMIDPIMKLQYLDKPLQQYTPYPFISIDKLIDQQIMIAPDHTAIIFHDEKMSYQQLQQKAELLAANLIHQGLKPNDNVAIALKRGFELLITMVAILKAGGCYVPLDLDFPRSRIDYMIKTSACRFVITKDQLFTDIDASTMTIIDYDKVSDLSFVSPLNRSMDDNMYILFTSGSTGEPKGVVLPHKALSNLKQAMSFIYEDIKTVLCSTNPIFDVFITEALLALAHGKTIIMSDENEMMYPWEMAKLIEHYQIDLVQYTPSRCGFCLNNEQFFSSLTNVKSMILVGEALTITLLRKLQTVQTLNIYNFYGPTEAAVYVSYKNLKDEKDVTIGKALANCRLYVLDKDLRVLPPMVSGELYLAGECLALGYLNQPALTAAAFLPDIYDPNKKMYKTGDVGYLDLNGEYVFINRRDSQIKLDGHRIELTEIDETILQNKAVKEALSIAIKRQDIIDHLESFVVGDIDQETLKIDLKSKLPAYMVPSIINIVDTIPLTPSGKADIKKLQAKNDERPTEHHNDGNLLATLRQIWKDTLDTDLIDDQVSFFDQGGTSLKALIMINSYYELGKQISMKDFYDNPTLVTQLALLDEQMVKTVEKQTDYYRLSVPHSKALTPAHNVFLTGASGFFGSHLLAKLCQENMTIYCLVRDKQRLIDALTHYFTADWYPQNKDKIVIIKGDITLTNLGLSSSMYQYLIDNIKEIYHCAANVNHYGNDQQILTTNLEGTKNIIELAKRSKSSLHYISTTGVLADEVRENRTTQGYFDENCFDIGQNWMDNIYTKSKFLAEEEVYQAIDNGLSGHVYRVGHLINRQNDGVFQVDPNNNEMYRILKGLKELKAIPKIMADIQIELTPVDDCVEAFMRLRYEHMTTYHLYNPHYLVLKDCLPELTVIEMNEYQAHLKTIDHQANPHIRDITATCIRLENAKQGYPISCQLTLDVLKKHFFTWSTLNIDMILK